MSMNPWARRSGVGHALSSRKGPSPAGLVERAGAASSALDGVGIRRAAVRARRGCANGSGVPASVMVSVARDPLDPVAAAPRPSTRERLRGLLLEVVERLSPAGVSSGRSPIVELRVRSWPVIMSSKSRVERGGRRVEDVAMKELVYHRHLLPAVERDARQGRRSSTASTRRRSRSISIGSRGSAARCAGSASGRGDRFAVMALNSHRFLELLPRRVPRRRCGQPAQPAARAEGARVHPRRLGHEGLLHRRLLRQRDRAGARRGRARARRDDGRAATRRTTPTTRSCSRPRRR